MKEAELKQIDFKSQLKYCYEDIQPFLEKELNELRNQFIKLPNSASEEQKLACVQACVEALNELDEQEDLEGNIDTDEREILCDFIYQMGDIVGLDGETQYVDEWRDW